MADTITVDLTKKCPNCGKKGATVWPDRPIGPCIRCLTDMLKDLR